jgi:hypothetical protein
MSWHLPAAVPLDRRAFLTRAIAMHALVLCIAASLYSA